MSKNDYGNGKDSQGTFTTAYGLAKQIKQDIDQIDLDEAYTGVTVDLEFNAGVTDIEYSIEATEVYTEMDYTPETIYFEGAGKIEPIDGVPSANEEIVAETLEDNLDSALKVNGKVVSELFSQDYDAF